MGPSIDASESVGGGARRMRARARVLLIFMIFIDHVRLPPTQKNTDSHSCWKETLVIPQPLLSTNKARRIIIADRQ